MGRELLIEVIKQAFQNQVILDGEIWLEMLAKKNMLERYFRRHNSDTN